MTATKQDFEFYRGDHAIVEITVRDQDTAALCDLTGVDVVWRAIHQTSCIQVFEKTTPAAVVIEDPKQGMMKIPLTSAETKDLRPGRYDHVAVVTDATGNVCTVTVGVMTVKSI